MISASSFLSTLVLLSELSGHLLTVAMPAAKDAEGGGGAVDQDGLGLILRDEAGVEAAAVPPLYRRSSSSSLKDEDQRKIIIVSDARLRGFHGLNSALLRGAGLLADQNLSQSTPAERSLKLERRNTDLDILRCMVGRVYRPCWEVVA